MDNPNITMEEYIMLEEEKSRRRGKVYNWETATYGKIWDNEDVHDLRSVETEFPVIVFNDTLTSEAALSCEPTVSSLNNDEINFRISFDEFDDEDCMVISDKKSFSYKIIFVNNFKTDSENDNERVNMPLLPSLEPTISCFDDLDFFNDLENEFLAVVYNDAQTSELDDLDYFNDFKNEFLAIVYNDAQTSKLDFLTEPTLSPQHIDEFDLNDKTSLSEYKDNDDDKVDIEHPSRDLSVKPLPDKIEVKVNMHCEKCKTEVLKAVMKLSGINEVLVNLEKQMLVVIRDVDPLASSLDIHNHVKVEIASFFDKIEAILSTLRFLKLMENKLESMKILENKLESLKLLENKLESMKILENKLESLKL
ncbi:putative reverse transcriptase domain-containing protein [Tanacetum coccineum]